MTFLGAWALFPLVLGAVTLGCGLFVERLAGLRLPGALLPAIGVAVVVTAGGLTTMTAATAQFTTPVVLALAAGGFALAWHWTLRRFDGWAVVTALFAFLIYGAPVLASGEATFAGYIILDDTATWLAITDRLMTDGTSVAGLAPSSYEAVLDGYLRGSGYPVGGNLPLGVGGQLTGIDVAWLFQPYLAFLAAMLALSLYSLLASLVNARWLRAVAAIIASQAALLYAYSLWGGLKEVAAAALVAVLAATLRPALIEQRSSRSSIVVAVAAAAVLVVLSLGGAAWLVLLVLIALAGGARFRRRDVVSATGVLAALTVVLALPAVVTATTFLEPSGAGAALTSGEEVGNLFHRLSRLQVLGIWPSGDFRTSPDEETITRVLLVLLAAAAAGGAILAWRRRAWELLLYAGTVLLGCALIVFRGSPWVDAKALAIASPVVLLVGLAGATAMFEGGRRVEALVVGSAIAGGVLWSNVLAYRSVSLAPREQLAELETIGKRFAGHGPTLMTEYQVYGVRHFLRRLDPEGASTHRRRLVPLRNGGSLDTGFSADLDEFETAAVLAYRTLVLRRSPVASRPPSPYELAWAGRFFEVWQRQARAEASVLEHLALGNRYEPGGVPACGDVMRLARLAASAGGRVAAVRRSRPLTMHLFAAGAGPPLAYGEDPRAPYLREPTRFELHVRVPVRGRYTVWLAGSVRSQVTAAIDGVGVGSARREANWPGQFFSFGASTLAAGTHVVTLDYAGRDWRPGSDGIAQFGAGPLVLARETADRPVIYLEADRARTLCGRYLDWVEAVAASG